MTGTLGEGRYDVVLADRSGSPMIGRIPDISSMRWNRTRDDVSQALVTVTRPGPECLTLLSAARAGRHELVFYRNNQRVWEGPITRVAFTGRAVEIEARDILWFAQKRALTTKIDWRKVGGSAGNPYDGQGQNVITGMVPILQQAYGSDAASDTGDYNVWPYLTPRTGPDDPFSKRLVEAYSRTVWEVLDNLAENGGMDYVVAGRRIIWFDTHLKTMELPRFSDDDFNDSLTLTEYASELVTRQYRVDSEGRVRYNVADTTFLDYYGRIDRIDTVHTESQQSDEAGTVSVTPVLDPKIGLHVPSRLHLHVPDNSTLSCDAPVGINELIPGAWVPIVTRLTGRPVSYWMKLDKVNVTVQSGTPEKVNVSFVQAPAKMVVP